MILLLRGAKSPVETSIANKSSIKWSHIENIVGLGLDFFSIIMMKL